MLAFVTVALALAASAVAQMSPTTPSGVTSRSNTTITWTKDTTGSWTDVSCKLMTGDNFAMVELSTLATGIDATTTDSISLDFPDVTPNSAIYFLQFQPAGNSSAYQWTTRFLIASATGGEVTEPTNSTQSDGSAVAWGTGAIADSNSTTSSVTTSASASSSGFISVTVDSSTAAVAAAVTTADSSASASATAESTSAAETTASSSSSASAAASTSASSSGAKVVRGVAGTAVVALMGLGWMIAA